MVSRPVSSERLLQRLSRRFLQTVRHLGEGGAARLRPSAWQPKHRLRQGGLRIVSCFFRSLNQFVSELGSVLLLLSGIPEMAIDETRWFLTATTTTTLDLLASGHTSNFSFLSQNISLLSHRSFLE